MVFTISLALAASFLLKFWGVQHPAPVQASLPVLFLMLGGPVLIVGIWSYILGFRED